MTSQRVPVGVRFKEAGKIYYFDGKDLDSVKTLRSHAERALRVAKVQGGGATSAGSSP